MGNGEAKELICTLRWGNAGGRGCAGKRVIKRGKWENCNSIINKIYFLKRESLEPTMGWILMGSTPEKKDNFKDFMTEAQLWVN